LNDEIIPKVFISYSWTNDDFVVPLVERLNEHGVDIVFDKWDLKEGQDKYEFMEKCVNDPDITKVLVICDKAYADKANGRKGGVGDETAIISSEVYGNGEQEKFIPVITEHDENDNPCVPTYMKSRIYIDFTDENDYEISYEKLLRVIYNKPSHRRPKRGERPDWLDEESVSLFTIKDYLKQIKGAKMDERAERLSKDFPAKYIETLIEFYDADRNTGEAIYQAFNEMKDVRDVFLDYLAIMPFSHEALGALLADFFEEAYNTLTTKDTFNPDSISWYENSFEIYRIFLWELFIFVTAFLLHKEDFIALNRLLTNTYFVKSLHSYNEDGFADYTAFRHHSSAIEEEYKPTTEYKQHYTLLGHCICNNREKKPVYTKKSIADADLFLYQIYNALDLNIGENIMGRNYWFPTLYVYANIYERKSIWKKMKSRRFAEKICTLVGVDTIDELKKRIEQCVADRDMRYTSFESVPSILAYVKPEEIGIYN